MTFYIALLSNVNSGTWIFARGNAAHLPQSRVSGMTSLRNLCVVYSDGLLKSSAFSKVVGFLQKDTLKASLKFEPSMRL